MGLRYSVSLMEDARSRLALFIPGLFGPVVKTAGADAGEGLRLRALPILLARGTATSPLGDATEVALCQLFGVRWPGGSDPPIAALTRLVDGPKSAREPSAWMRADPVHLSPDSQRLLLLDSSAFTLHDTEAQALAAELQPLMQDVGGQLEVAVPARWYLGLGDIPRIRTRTLTEALGRDIHGFMPSGSDRELWHRLINEVQMVLHATAVNAAREERGELPINSLWFWGAGRLPEPPERRWARVYSDDLLSRGLAAFTRTPIAGLPDRLEALQAGLKSVGNVLVIFSEGLRYSHYPDIEGWREFILRLERDWFAPLLLALKTKQLSELTIFTGDSKSFTVNRSALWRWWRRAKPVRQYGV